LISRYWFCLYQYSYGKTRSEETAAEITRNIFIELWEYRCYIPRQFLHCRFICMKGSEKK
jgi:hypothetical protein